MLYFSHYEVHLKAFNSLQNQQCALCINSLRAFKKAGIITVQPSNSNQTDLNNDERDAGVLDAETEQNVPVTDQVI